jgi:predicted homoserine dehydrogenase-like protein
MTDRILERALGMIGAHVVDRHALQAGETAFENAFGRARSRGLDQQQAFDEATIARNRAIIAASKRTTAVSNDNEAFPPDSHLDAVVDAALNAEPA